MLTSVEICAGAGGQALGLEKAGFAHVSLVEIEAAACQTLRLDRPHWRVTGIVTDIGIELGRMVYWNRDPDPQLRPVHADLGHLALLTGLLLLFFGGGVVGAMSFARIGYVTTVPLAALLLLLAAVPVGDDLYRLRKRLLAH